MMKTVLRKPHIVDCASRLLCQGELLGVRQDSQLHRHQERVRLSKDSFAKIQMIPQAWTNPYWRYHFPLNPHPIHRQNYPGALFWRRRIIIIGNYYLLA